VMVRVHLLHSLMVLPQCPVSSTSHLVAVCEVMSEPLKPEE
jgi:hypothetical protein